jgi:hypothetical protein
MDRYREIGPLAVLSRDEMEFVQALPTKDKRDLIISGYIDFTLRRVMLFRGDGTSLMVSMVFFEPRPKLAPNFDEFSIIDHGLTLKFGEYEAAVDYVLYEHDPSYKVRADANRVTN